MQEMRSVRLRISGRVQGVGFRAWAARNAAELGLAGWVRNCRDGTVEAAFEGPADSIAEMLGRCARGPSYAAVRSVDVLGEAADVGKSFVVLRGE